jgi:hypothetical protein
MIELLLKFLGVWTGRAEKIVRVVPDYHGDVALGLVLPLLLVLCGAGIWFYWKTDVQISRNRRWLLASLRTAFLVLVVLILIRPILSVTIAGSVRQSLLVLVDSSSSMKIEDIRDNEDDLKRAAIATKLISVKDGLKPALKDPPAALRNISRLNLAKGVLRNDKLDLLSRLAEDYDLSVSTFDREVADISFQKTVDRDASDSAKEAARQGTAAAQQKGWVDRLGAEGPVTALGDAVRDTILRKRGQPIAGIWIVSDFASNSGSLPVEAARMAKDEQIPLYLYGIGTTSPKDIIVGGVFAPETAFIRDEVSVTVRVRSQGLAGQKARLVLRMDGKDVDSKEIELRENGEEPISLTVTPGTIGNKELQAFIEPRGDEVVKDNNLSVVRQLRVIDGRIKVLQIEQTPRWEFKYLQAMLMRDRRVDYKCLLFEAEPSVTETPNSPYLKELPKLKELGDKFDLVIIGDVEPAKLPPAFLADVSEFVSRLGGSMIVVAGRQYTPAAYKRTTLEKMLPVEFDRMAMDALAQVPADKPVRLELTPLGKSNPMLRLAEKETDNLAKWAQLPPIYWAARVSRAKAGAEVLVVDSDPAKASRYGKMPVIALQQYGLGQVLFVGTDNTWRWRKNLDSVSFTTLWSQMVERMAMPHMLGAAKRTQLSTDREKYATGDRVTVYARLYRERDLEPMTEPLVRAYYSQSRSATTGATGPGDTEVALRALPDQPGMYRAEFSAPAPGVYSLRVGGDVSSQVDFNVTEPKLEMGETALNLPLMKEMAEQSGGAVLREEDLYRLPDLIKSTSQPVLSQVEVELWCSPLYYLLLLSVVTAEWIVRKLSYLK